MSDAHTNQLVRSDVEGWTVVDSDDNDVEIIARQIDVDNFAQAVEVANKIAPIVTQYEPLDSGFALHVRLTRWVVELRLSVPKGYWESALQEKLAISLAKIS